MTREELERTIAGMMDGAYSTDEAALEAARDAVRLVVEACCAVARHQRSLARTSALGEGHYLGCAAVEAALRRTFLPTTEPTDG